MPLEIISKLKIKIICFFFRKYSNENGNTYNPDFCKNVFFILRLLLEKDFSKLQ